jgi:hypothetical protein
MTFLVRHRPSPIFFAGVRDFERVVYYS